MKLPSNRSRSSQGGRIRAKSSQRQNRLTTSDIVVMMSPPDSSDSQTILPDYDRRSDAITRIRDGEKVSVCSSSSSSSSSGVSQTDSDYHSNNTITTDVLSNNSHNSNQSNVVQRKVDSAAHTTFFWRCLALLPSSVWYPSDVIRSKVPPTAACVISVVCDIRVMSHVLCAKVILMCMWTVNFLSAAGYFGC